MDTLSVLLENLSAYVDGKQEGKGREGKGRESGRNARASLVSFMNLQQSVHVSRSCRPTTHERQRHVLLAVEVLDGLGGLLLRFKLNKAVAEAFARVPLGHELHTAHVQGSKSVRVSVCMCMCACVCACDRVQCACLAHTRSHLWSTHDLTFPKGEKISRSLSSLKADADKRE